jgi:5-hydroxyisourate hydrolase
MSALTTHVLDTSAGRPAPGVAILLEISEAGAFRVLSRGQTDADGRCGDLLPASTHLAAGIYRLSFDSGAYFAARGVETFYPRVQLLFEVRAPSEHHHVPLLLSPYGYTTYRGS